MKKLWILIMALVMSVSAQEIAIVKLLQGNVKASSAGKSVNLKLGSMLDENMVVETSAKSSTTIVFNDNSVLVLSENSIINLKKYVFKPSEKSYDFQLFLKHGSATFESGKIGEVAPESFIFETPQGTVSIRGTKFLVNVE